MRTSESGTVTVFVSVFMVALLVVAGLVIDGGKMLAARREAANIAESAARFGAQELDEASVRAGAFVKLDPVAARAAASHYLAVAGVTGEVSVTEDAVHVTVTAQEPLFILGVVGMDGATVTGTGEARAVRGIVEEGR